LIRGAGRAELSSQATAGGPSPSLLAHVEPVTFSSLDGTPIHGQLFRPPRFEGSGRLPAVIYLHGGPRRQMLLGWHPLEYYHNAYAFNQFLAANGYLVLSINFRSGTGYGLEFREALRYGAAGASEFQDVVAAAEWLRRRAEVDPNRIGLWGGSYGGYLTALGLARRPDLFAAGVDLHGVHDWRSETRLYLPSDDLETQQAALRLALASSPLADVSRWRAPVLLIHGDDDRNVEFIQTIRLVEALRRRGVAFEQLILPDEVHSFLLHASWQAAFRAAADFFDRRLMPTR
jgi:dipeptidyl aminopeptidase/acylaminoacyl peptidase